MSLSTVQCTTADPLLAAFSLPISPLRMLGIAIGLLFLYVVARQVRHRTWTRFQVLLWMGIGWATLLVSAAPGIASFVFGPFSLADGAGFPRLVGLLIVAVFFLLFYQFYLTANIENGRRELTGLVREMALARYLRECVDAPAPDVLIVVPAYNEEETLAAVLEDLPDRIGDLRAQHVVVVDGATDRTEEVARRYGVPCVLAVNRGQTAALITGYEIAKRRGAQIVATIDADGQMVAAELADLVLPIAQGQFDLVNGSRVLGSHEAESAIRSVGVSFFGLLATLLLRRRVTDTSVGMRAIRVESLERMQLREERYGAAELLVEAQRRGLRIQEVPVTILARSGGETRKPAALRYGARFASAMIRSWLR